MAEKEMMELSNMLVSLRKELQEAQQKGAEEDIKFKVEDVELELQFTTQKEDGGKIGAKFWILSGEMADKCTTGSIQKIRLKLSAIDEKNPDGDLKLGTEGTRS